MAQPGSLQKSFIPKSGAGVSGAGRRPRSSFTTIPNIVAGLIFFVVAGAAVGVFVYGQFLQSEIEASKEQIAQAYGNINLERQEELRSFDARLKAGSRLLAMHNAPSRLLASIGNSTLSRIEFEVLELTMVDGSVMLTIEGIAPDFAAVAAQADELRDNQELQSALVNNLEIDQTDQGDVVAFTIEAEIRPEAVRYQPGSSTRTRQETLPREDEIGDSVDDDLDTEPEEGDTDVATDEDENSGDVFFQEEVEDEDPETTNDAL